MAAHFYVKVNNKKEEMKGGFVKILRLLQLYNSKRGWEKQGKKAKQKVQFTDSLN